MTQATRAPVLGTRPQLGVLVLDDGTALALCGDLVLGRAPHGDTAVRAGTATGVPMADPTVSAVHARFQLDGWDVRLVDAGSTNGTFVWAPDASSWQRVPAGAGVVLRPGTAVAVGRQQICYLSYRNSYRNP
jgi:hypothetical protein